MEYIVYTSGNELYHHGIRGMKWGVRRYQNKDGSLTPAGKKRRDKLESELEKLGGGNKKSTEDGAITRTKSISEMSNKELQEYTTRMQLEKQYYDAKRNLDSVTPKQVNKGKQFANKMFDEVIKPAGIDAGKKMLDKAISKALGDANKETVASLKEAYEKLDYKQKIDKIKNPDKYLTEDDKNKRQTRTFEAEDRAAKMEGYANAADKAAKEREAKETERKAAADESARAANSARSEEYYNSTYSRSGGERTDPGRNSERGLSVINDSSSSTVTSLATRSNVSTGMETVNFILQDRGGNPIRSYTSNNDVSYKRDDD